MKKCPQCNANISDTAKFCPMCGYNIKKYEEENNKKNKTFCQECGTELEKETLFCTECGSKINNDSLFDNSFNDDFLSNISSSTSQQIEKSENNKLFIPFIKEEHLDGTYTIVGLKDKNALQYIIPEGVVSIASHAFEGCNAISITLPNSIMQIGDYSFKNCYNLETINLPNSLKIIGEGAFENCEILDIAIPKTVSRIGKDAIKNTLPDKKRQKEVNDIRVGSVIKLGNYYIDDSNTREPIEWLVLEKKENKVLLISKYGIEYSAYHETDEEVTWEICDLRSWLNNDFLSNSFSEQEKNMILNTRVHTNDNSKYGTSGGNDTIDKIFLLSIEEVEKYFKNDEDKVCCVTEYCKEFHGCWEDHSTWWWLRSSGNDQGRAAYGFGFISYGGAHVNDDYGCVRPALWINLKS